MEQGGRWGPLRKKYRSFRDSEGAQDRLRRGAMYAMSYER